MKTALFNILLLLLVFLSCKKESPSDQPDPVVTGPDTLSTGWSKVNVPIETYMDIFLRHRLTAI
ncbi:MAG: hypothetical protein KF746_00370 [Chitinophagaceae bacterium]|nr:hypothetical protein [Chitinophagaceae bacterium]